MLFLSCLCVPLCFCQNVHFNQVNKGANVTVFADVAIDRQGYFWMVGYAAGSSTLMKYDGTKFIYFKHEEQNANSPGNGFMFRLFIDEGNIIWIGYLEGGLDRFDPATNSFTHYRHNPKDPATLSNDSVLSILKDPEGYLWVGTQNGLNRMDIKTGKCTRFFHQPGNPKSLSYNAVWCMCTDNSGNLWVGCASTSLYSSAMNESNMQGGLNLFNKTNNTFTSYLHDSTDNTTIANNYISSIYPDRSGALWIGTFGNHLDRMDTKKGIFAHYDYDPAHPQKLCAPPITSTIPKDVVTFITRDSSGTLWVGTQLNGMTGYDTDQNTATHYGTSYVSNQTNYIDTAAGFSCYNTIKGLTSYDGLFWVFSRERTGDIFNYNPLHNNITSIRLHNRANGNSFYQQPDGRVIWIGTNKGLIRRDIGAGLEKVWVHDPRSTNSLSCDTIGNMKVDDNGIFWIATVGGGLCRFDPLTGNFNAYQNDPKNKQSIGDNLVRNLWIDHDKNIWLGFYNGMDMFDPRSGKFIHYRHNGADSTSLVNNIVDNIFEDKNHAIWAGTFGGLERLDQDRRRFHHYLFKIAVFAIFADSYGVLWVGSSDGLYHYDTARDAFIPFIDPGTGRHLNTLLCGLEDNDGNLWLRCTNSLIEIDKARLKAVFYGEGYGVTANYEWISRCIKGKDGELFFGGLGGFNDFFPRRVKEIPPPQINLTSFQLLNAGATYDHIGIAAVRFNTTEMRLRHNQNSFNVDFFALHYNSSGEEKYQVMLENYDQSWRDLGIEHQTSFFNLAPGKYLLKIKAFNSDGGWNEKDFPILVAVPWWKTWWAYLLYILLGAAAIGGFIQYRSRKLIRENALLEQKVNERTDALKKSIAELRATQQQLIQSEKMASLGELTAGIAHEIQNPLNFVNNFSEVSNELLDEMKNELAASHTEAANAIADDIKQNLEKILHHGKRADAIVKGMIQHSRSGTGQKELSDINALADEFLHLSYHGLRAKDKSFNARMITDYDEDIGKINIVSQDIGRVLLNLYNNAFYAVADKKKQNAEGYEPTISVSTKKIKDKVEIKVKDNGNGIPRNAVDKIFQPFFTTKPPGQGTGLGLSLSYDIIKAHRGELKVDTLEGTYTELIILLPLG